MLTFYPEFEAESPPEVELLFLLDLSCSMKVSSSVVFFSLCLRLCCLGGRVRFRSICQLHRCVQRNTDLLLG